MLRETYGMSDPVKIVIKYITIFSRSCEKNKMVNSGMWYIHSHVNPDRNWCKSQICIYMGTDWIQFLTIIRNYSFLNYYCIHLKGSIDFRMNTNIYRDTGPITNHYSNVTWSWHIWILWLLKHTPGHPSVLVAQCVGNGEQLSRSPITWIYSTIPLIPIHFIACFWRNMRGIFSDKPSYSLQNTGKLLAQKTLEPAKNASRQVVSGSQDGCLFARLSEARTERNLRWHSVT